ncbi:OPA3-domain-containing protein [Peniophora sp. CONT]|nr:OPA3-domain-containing protein [Peniophora sp. CONT]
MATVKIGTLVIRTLAKPISNQIKMQVKNHETFRKMCVSLAQTMHRSEIRLRTKLLGEPARNVRPLSEAKAIDNGANFLAEGFLFSVAAGLIFAESWRSSRSESKRREGVSDSLDDLRVRLDSIETRAIEWEERAREAQERQDALTRVLSHIVDNGMRGGWLQLPDTPLAAPTRAALPPPPASTSGWDTSTQQSQDDAQTTTSESA